MWVLVAMAINGGFVGVESKVDAYHKPLNKTECQKTLENYKKDAAKAKQGKVDFKCFEWKIKP